MTQLFCILEHDGRPVKTRLMKRRLTNLFSINEAVDRIVVSGKWSRVEQLCAWIPLRIQFADWVSSLIEVNPQYVLDPGCLVAYVRGDNWNNPDVEFAHYETTVRCFGDELWHEFSSYRGASVEESVRRYTWLLESVGLKAVENV